jgi:pyruvate formate lyase activating enzyme
MRRYTLYTTAGCSRCRIAKKFLAAQGVAYAEKDFKGDGKEDFNRFYRDHRRQIRRSEEGVQFPILTDGDQVRQGLAAVLAGALAGGALDGFTGASGGSGEWVDGLQVDGGEPAHSGAFLEMLASLKQNGMKLELRTDGGNPALLEMLLTESLGDRVVMRVKGPLPLYARMAGGPIDAEEVCKSIALTARFPEHRFETIVGPVARQAAGTTGLRYLSPEEIGATARLIKEATGDHRQPYRLRRFRPEEASDESMQALEPLGSRELLAYRAAARKHLVFTEIEKGP